jgi:hypothetical protein
MYCESDSTRSPYSLEVDRIQTGYDGEIHRLNISAHKLLRVNMLIWKNNHDITSYAVSYLLNNSWSTHHLSKLLCSCALVRKQPPITRKTSGTTPSEMNTKLQ